MPEQSHEEHKKLRVSIQDHKTRTNKCWTCREEGHITSNCPQKRTFQISVLQYEKCIQNKRYVATLDDEYENDAKEDDPKK